MTKSLLKIIHKLLIIYHKYYFSSLKTESNLEVVKMLPLDSLCLETDAPWCEIRPTHAGSKYLLTKFEEYPSVKREKWKKGCMVKSRNEPCCIR